MPSREQIACTGPTRPSVSFSRRAMLGRGIGLGLLGVFAGQLVPARRAQAAAKMDKQDAGYRDTPRGGMRCDRCVQFQPPEGCNVVQGAISPSGSCYLFAPKPN